jgi:bifunctional DNA-binding transcriptional regulator/antitoxin component of YhaV-PrlF toxin-antitoxin module
MTVTVKTKTSAITLPAAVRRRAGFKAGDVLEFKAAGGVVTIRPKSPTADDEYTPEQRAMVDARLAEARKSPHHGPFDTAGEAIEFLRKEIKNRKTIKRKTT